VFEASLGDVKWISPDLGVDTCGGLVTPSSLYTKEYFRINRVLIRT